MARPIWFEFPADDPARAVAFYQQVFGWKITEFPGMKGYFIIETPGGPDATVGGAIMGRDFGACTRNTTAVDSLEEWGRRIEQAGGTMNPGRLPIPSAVFATAIDTEGNEFGLLEPTGEEQMKEEMPASETPGMFSVVHFEIPADDPQRALRFYESVFGWRAQKWEGPMDYWLLETGERGTPGMNGAIMPRGQERCLTDTIAIPDIEAYVSKVKQAGGEITMGPEQIPGVGQIAMCRDTEGTVFGIIEPAEMDEMAVASGERVEVGLRE